MSDMKRFTLSLLTLFSALALISDAKAVACYALTDTNHLLTFDSATPGTVTDVDLTPNIPAGSELVGIAMRITTKTTGAANPGVGSLWALCHDGGTYKLFVVKPSGAVTQIGSALTALSAATVGDSAWGFAFDPATDSFQAVGVNFNFWIDPNTATAVRRPDVHTVGSVTPAFSGASFTTASYGGTSRFYIVNTGENHNLCTSANIDAGGLISEAGATQFGTATMFSQPNGLAINQSLAFLGASNGNFYRISLSTGIATLIGAFPPGTGTRSVIIKPSSFPPILTATVTIKGKKKIVTTKPKLLIKGTAASEAGIKAVQYKVGKDGFKTATGTTRWKFKAKLKPGKNKILVQAVGGNGVTSAPRKVTVTLQ